MIQHLEPYPAMKESGVKWLEQVPAHWNVRRLRNVAEMRVSNVDKHTTLSEEPVRLCNYVDVYKNDYIRPSMPFMRATATREEIVRFHLLPGDVLVTKDSETWDDIAVPALVVQSADDLISGYHLALLRPFPRCLSGAYLFRSLQSTAVAYQFHVEANGVTRYGLSHAAIKSILLPIPPLPEQTAIVRFLDHADRRIRRYIRAKQKLITLLEAQKQAIVQRAVTHGIDPSVRFEPSRAQWLGNVPNSWEVIRLKYVASQIVDCLHATPVYSDRGEYPAIRTADISPGVVRLSAARRVDETVYRQWIQRLEPAAGDILYSREGERFGIAACVPQGVQLCISQRMMVFRIRREHNSQFIMWLLNSAQLLAQANQDVMGATAPHVNVSTIRNFVLAVPALGEQNAIVEHIDNATLGFVEAIEHVRREIALLRELRVRLVSDVVTGKLDVREAAARLPDVVDESESIEGADDEADVDEPADDLDGTLEAAGA